MIDQKVLGKRIKYFRQRAKLSQFRFELELEMSTGSLSRIESGEVNPTKETIEKIEKVLNLTDKEKSYLYGVLFNSASETEILIATNEVKKYFETQGVIAYLVDDRYRLISVSKSLISLFQSDEKGLNIVIGKSIIEIIINPKLGVMQLLSKKYYEEVLYNLLERYYSEVSFMIDDDLVKNTLEIIKNDEVASKIWKKLENIKPSNVHTVEKRRVYFNILGFDLPFVYTDEHLPKSERFELVEYLPDGKIVKLLSKLI